MHIRPSWLQTLTGLALAPWPIPRAISGPELDRLEPCRLCGARKGQLIAEAHFWDIKETRLLACNCGLTQLDPMLTEEETALGCYAYYLDELKRVSPSESARNCIRNYRRGVALAARMRSDGIHPERIMEIGPGNGYFTAGMKFVFPDALVTVLDIVDDVLKQAEQLHGFETIKGTPETIDVDAGQFDFLIARDVIEHTIDVGKVLSNVYRLLKPGGHFHFLVPNGHEDRWGAYVRWHLTKEPAEILINHVNYFDPEGLENYLRQVGFETVNYYVGSIKGTRRGQGWKISEKLASAPSTRRSARAEVENASNAITQIQSDRPDIRDQWWHRPNQKWLASSYCKFKNFNLIRVPASLKIGHEVNALMKKTANNRA